MTIKQVFLQPSVIVLIGGVINIFVNFFNNSKSSERKIRNIVVPVALIVTSIGFISSIISLLKFNEPKKYFYGSLVSDRFSCTLSALICAIAFISILLMSNTDIFDTDAFSNTTGVWTFILFSISGMILLVSTNDYITMFIAIELMSIPLYLTIIQSKRQKGILLEGAVKYLVLGGISSAIMLFGMCFLYGTTQSIYLSDIIDNLEPSKMDQMLFLGIILVFIGFFFKIGAIPFHWWVPSVYEGAPAVFSGFMASLVKLAGFGGFIRIVFLICPSLDLTVFIVPVALLTIIFGTLLAVSQKNIKRLLVYSSINHAGFVLIGIAGFTQKSISSSIFYLTIYSLSVLGSFGIIWVLRKPKLSTLILSESLEPSISKLKKLKPTKNNSILLSELNGFGVISPLFAFCLSIFFLSFAGLPLTSGFIAKYLILTSNVPLYLVIIAILMSVVALFFYAKVIFSMFFKKPTYATATVTPGEITPFIVIIVLAVLVVLLGIYPNLLISFAQKAAFLFI